MAGITIATQDGALVRTGHAISLYSSFSLEKYFDGNLWPKMNLFGLVKLLDLSKLPEIADDTGFHISPVETATSNCFFVVTVMICGKWAGTKIDIDLDKYKSTTALFIGVSDQKRMDDFKVNLSNGGIKNLDVYLYGCNRCSVTSANLDSIRFHIVRQFDSYDV